MKTFLHYTKQKELDEGFMDSLRDAGQRVGNAAEKTGSFITAVRQSPFSALLKPGRGGAALGQAFEDAAEKRKNQRETCKKLKDRELPFYQKKLAAAQAQAFAATSKKQKDDAEEEVSYYEDRIEDIRDDMKKYKCPGATTP